MPLVQGSALWSLQRVFTHSRSANVAQNTEEEPESPSQSTSFWKSSCTSHLFHRRSGTAPRSPPRRSTSAPLDFTVKLVPGPSSSSASTSSKEKCKPAAENIISKSTSVPHTFPLKPMFLKTSPKNCMTGGETTDTCIQTNDPPNPSQVEQSAMEKPNNPLDSSTSDHKPVSALLHEMSSGIMPSVSAFTFSTDRKDPPDPPISLRSSRSPTKTAISHSQQSKPSPTSSPLKSSPGQSPLKSPCHHSPSRRHSPQSQQMPVAPGPTWSELLEARRRLMLVEGQRQAICALEMRVQQVQYVFLQTELRVARQREALARLVEAAGRAEVQATVHGQRIRRALRKHKPRLLACALCVPWGTRSERRSGQHARHPRCAFFQGRVPALRGCAGGEDVGVRD